MLEQIPEYINLLSYLFVAVYMLSVPLETTRGEIIKTLGHLSLMGRALLANFVIIPIIGIAIAGFFDLPPDIRIGFLLLAMAPGGLLALQFARVSKGNRIFAVALLFVFCLLAILVTPAIVLLFFHREGAGKLPFAWLMLMLFILIVVPALVGRGLQRLIPQHAPKLGLWLGRLSIVIFIIAAVMAGRYKSPAIKLMGTNGIEAIIILILGSWVVGWLLGGPEIRNRKVLAISSSMRNVGVCLPIASNYFAGTDVFVPMLAFSGIMIPMNMVFALVTGRALRDQK
ncbi:MAG TPA: bile acid:sodium symporter [Candidatus Binatia bacterium]|nr:bile acid:sodium symporter [Candidatus Binatia bacterium]